MLYEPRKRNWRKAAIVAVAAFSLAAAWIVARPLIRRQGSGNGGNGTDPAASREAERKTEKAREDMDRLGKIGNGASSPGTDEIRKRMDELKRDSESLAK